MPDARRIALSGLLDYAGPFPPARLPIPEAEAEYRRLRASPAAWFVGRFIVPASGLAEVGGADLPLSVVLDAPGVELPPSVVMVETKGDVPDRLPPVTVVVEVPWRDEAEMLARLKELAGTNRLAKLRCGGLTTEAFPPPEWVAAFQHACRDLALRYKLTAGLHQPLRHVDPATGFAHHGFVNLLAADALGRAHDLDVTEMGAIAAEEDGDAFGLTADGLRWRHLHATGADLERARRHGFAAFGSCDAQEPLAALATRGWT